MAVISGSVEDAANLLRQGRLVAIPTETVYGLAGNALDPDAVAEIFRVKNRPHFNPLIVHTHSLEAARGFVRSIPEQLEHLARVFWPGPLTLLLPRDPAIIPDLVTAGSDRVAVRVPDHALTLQLLSSLPFPLCAPSANPFGYVSPTLARHVQEQLGDQIPMILDGGPCEVGVESTIVGMEGGEVVVYRKGGLTLEELEAERGGKVRLVTHAAKPDAPGMLTSHYAPESRLILASRDALASMDKSSSAAALVFSSPLPGIPATHQRVLSPSGDLKEAARNLFRFLRELDSLHAGLILAESVPDIGLGRAINDRLRRAAEERQ